MSKTKTFSPSQQRLLQLPKVQGIQHGLPPIAEGFFFREEETTIFRYGGFMRRSPTTPELNSDLIACSLKEIPNKGLFAKYGIEPKDLCFVG
jgi:hypothetical protein